MLKVQNPSITFWLFLIICQYTTGVPNVEERIVGGSQVAPNELPYQVAIYYREDAYACSGAVIDESHILTSAYCAEGGIDLGGLFVSAGEHSIRFDDRTEQKFPVREIAIHPGFDRQRVVNDIAVLKLSQPLTFNNVVKPIPLAPLGHQASGTVLLSGWGAIYNQGPVSDILRKITSHVTMKDSECRKVYQVTDIIDTMICTKSSEGEDTCDGDSGAPVVCYDIIGSEGNPMPYLCGISSWGRGCGAEFPSVHTEISYYNTWITQYATNANVVVGNVKNT